MQGRGATTAPVAAEPRPIARKFVDVLREEFTALHPGADAGRTLADLYAAIHRLEPPQSALCLSGGGIRSASFALGVLQALARHGLLFRFDYLSTVSGGGYIGSWLSAWRRHARDDNAVLQSLTTRAVDPADEVPELRALRASSNYLTPRKGVMSPDTWTAAALVVRNLVLNWTIFLPLLVAVVLVPIGAAEFIGWSPLWPSPWPQLCLVLATALLVWALTQSLVSRSGVHGHGIDQGRFLRRILIPQYLAATLLGAVASHPLLASAARSTGGWLALGAGAGVVIYGVAWWIAFLWRRPPSAGLPHWAPRRIRYLHCSCCSIGWSPVPSPGRSLRLDTSFGSPRVAPTHTRTGSESGG
jgi:hypothetical protein